MFNFLSKPWPCRCICCLRRQLFFLVKLSSKKKANICVQLTTSQIHRCPGLLSSQASLGSTPGRPVPASSSYLIPFYRDSRVNYSTSSIKIPSIVISSPLHFHKGRSVYVFGWVRIRFVYPQKFSLNPDVMPNQLLLLPVCLYPPGSMAWNSHFDIKKQQTKKMGGLDVSGIILDCLLWTTQSDHFCFSLF